MKKTVISFIVFTLFTFGTALASPEFQILNQRVQKSDIVFADFSKIITEKKSIQNIGFIDVSKIMAENPRAKDFQGQLNQLGENLSNQLEAEKANLTPIEFRQKQEEAYGEFTRVKQEMEDRINASLRQAVERVAREKNLVMIVNKMNVDLGTINVTMDVMKNME